jgi:hypothetical protein
MKSIVDGLVNLIGGGSKAVQKPEASVVESSVAARPVSKKENSAARKMAAIESGEAKPEQVIPFDKDDFSEF